MRLANFDPKIVADYGITEEDLDQVARYLRLLQGPDALALEDIAIGGYYGTYGLMQVSMTFTSWPSQMCGFLSSNPSHSRFTEPGDC